jgi:hypothetical protein
LEAVVLEALEEVEVMGPVQAEMLVVIRVLGLFI